MSVAITAATSTELTVQVTNTGSTSISDFSNMDFIFQYESTSGQTIAKRFSYDTTGAITHFNDTFDRPDSSTVGNGWTETEKSGAEVSIASNTLDFLTGDKENKPRVQHSMPTQSSGTLTWTYDFNWERTGSESDYELWMQLGDSTLMTNPETSDNAGIAVNLLWAGDENGMATDDGFGHVNGATVTQVATINGGPTQAGEHLIEVEVDLDNNTFDIDVDGVPRAASVPFDNDVNINSIRIYTDEVSDGNFGSRYFDDIAVETLQGADTWALDYISPDNFEPGILNPGETAQLTGMLVPAMKAGGSGTLAVVTSNGVSTTVSFTN